MMEVMDIRREVLRNVVLCQGLEALVRKARLAAATGPRVESLLVAGVNSAWPFYDLADRILTAGGQPDCIFDTACAAQSASLRNRTGGKVDYGPISLLIPVVTAQVLEYLETGTHEDIEAILLRTGDVLHNTTEKDVESLEEYIQLGYEVSVKGRERTGDPKPRRTPELKGRFTNVLDAITDFPRNPNVREMSQGFPFSHQVYRFLLHNLEGGLEGGILPASALISQLLLAELQRPDVVSDFVAVGIYLVLSKHPESVLLS